VSVRIHSFGALELATMGPDLSVSLLQLFALTIISLPFTGSLLSLPIPAAQQLPLT